MAKTPDEFLDSLPLGDAPPSFPEDQIDEEVLSDQPPESPAPTETPPPAAPPTKKKVIKKVRRRVEKSADAATPPVAPGPPAKKVPRPQPPATNDSDEPEAMATLPSTTPPPATLPPVTPAPATLPPATSPKGSDELLKDDELKEVTWDNFLESMTQATRIAIWEVAVNSLPELQKYARMDLMRPKGRLTEQQVDEVETWLNAHDMKLSLVSISSHMSRGGLSRDPSRVGRGAADQTALPEGASVGQKRTHRVKQNRLTM